MMGGYFLWECIWPQGLRIVHATLHIPIHLHIESERNWSRSSSVYDLYFARFSQAHCQRSNASQGRHSIPTPKEPSDDLNLFCIHLAFLVDNSALKQGLIWAQISIYLLIFYCCFHLPLWVQNSQSRPCRLQRRYGWLAICISKSRSAASFVPATKSWPARPVLW